MGYGRNHWSKYTYARVYLHQLGCHNASTPLPNVFYRVLFNGLNGFIVLFGLFENGESLKETRNQ